MDVNRLLAEAALDRKNKARKTKAVPKRAAAADESGYECRQEEETRWGASERGSRTEPEQQIPQRSGRREPARRAPVHRYPDGRAYANARGRSESSPVEVIDSRDWRRDVAVIDLQTQQPSPMQFTKAVAREMKLRDYAPGTVDQYQSGITSFLRWSGLPPHRLTREHVREYLELRKGMRS